MRAPKLRAPKLEGIGETKRVVQSTLRTSPFAPLKLDSDTFSLAVEKVLSNGNLSSVAAGDILPLRAGSFVINIGPSAQVQFEIPTSDKNKTLASRNVSRGVTLGYPGALAGLEDGQRSALIRAKGDMDVLNVDIAFLDDLIGQDSARRAALMHAATADTARLFVGFSHPIPVPIDISGLESFLEHPQSKDQFDNSRPLVVRGGYQIQFPDERKVAIPGHPETFNLFAEAAFHSEDEDRIKGVKLIPDRGAEVRRFSEDARQDDKLAKQLLRASLQRLTGMNTQRALLVEVINEARAVSPGGRKRNPLLAGLLSFFS